MSGNIQKLNAFRSEHNKSKNSEKSVSKGLNKAQKISPTQVTGKTRKTTETTGIVNTQVENKDK